MLIFKQKSGKFCDCFEVRLHSRYWKHLSTIRYALKHVFTPYYGPTFIAKVGKHSAKKPYYNYNVETYGNTKYIYIPI